MIEMLGVLAIIGVLSIGGIALYRRAVNNHHANTILDDVNRFAFVIIERGNYPLDADISKGDFKESGIYTLTAHQAAGANQFSILVQNVPKGVCEPLVDKANIDYKVGVVAAGGSVDDEVLYDTLHTDLCQEVNDIAFYFGDTANVCNTPEGNGVCTTNADCCGREFCVYINATNKEKGEGVCHLASDYGSGTGDDTKTVKGRRFIRSSSRMNYWSAESWFKWHGMTLASRASIGCDAPCGKSGFKFCTKEGCEETASRTYAYEGSVLYLLQTEPLPTWITSYHWLLESGETAALAVNFNPSRNTIDSYGHTSNSYYALCH